MAEDVKIVPPSTDAVQKIGYIGARLREKSTYGGLAVLIGIALPMLIKSFPQLSGTSAETIISAISNIGLGVGVLIGVFLPEKGTVNRTLTVVKILLLAFLPLVLLANASPVSAQTRKIAPPAMTGDLGKDLSTDARNLGLGSAPPKLITGNAEKDAHAIWDKLVAASQTDLKYASALAAAANTPASAVRKQCYDAIIVLNTQVNGMNVKDAGGNILPQPDPKLFTGVEQAAETIDNLAPSGPLFTACAGMAQLTKTNVLTLINSIVTGAAAFAVMPVIPGL